MADQLEVLALAFARDALDKQESVLAELRARTGTLLAVSSIVASFLGAAAIRSDGLSVWSAAALVALTGTLALCLWILLPRDDLSFSVDGPKVYEGLYELRGDPLEIHHRLAYDLRGRHRENQRIVERLFGRFRLACCTLALETRALGACAGGNLKAMADKPSAPPPPPPPTPGIFIPEKRGSGEGSKR